ncbi:MAG: hypothetical protein GY737_29525 [Desulfobacteraceae bacterium]|nr:hypothetical protein [Desulfobacteraceae bacterium]
MYRTQKQTVLYKSCWMNKDSQMDGIIRAGLAHLWFITLHPFDDGNGRIARTLTSMLLTGRSMPVSL